MSSRPISFVLSLLLSLLLAAACVPGGDGQRADHPEPGLVDAKQLKRVQPTGEIRLAEEIDAARPAASTVKGAAVEAERLTAYQDAASAAPVRRSPVTQTERDNYAHFDDNPLKRVAEAPVSTFSIDVDTGAYANVRRWLNVGRLPPRDAVRVEELINYFDYAYAPPSDDKQPFAAHTEIAPAPWNPDTHLLQIGIKGFEVAAAERPAANLVFLVDVSGSMQDPNKLELLKPALKLLVDRLEARDRIAIAVYAGASGVALPPTAGDHKAQIRGALDALTAGGSTNGADGIRLAYALAEQSFTAGGINRVILATDGDFNVGTVNFEALKDLVARKRESGVALTTLGFGAGNYNDHLMEQLADAGNGNHAYIDNLNEARKVLVSQMSGTLQTIAQDVKIQIEFNPAVVSEYRLIGYENRALKREDFSNDRVDAGDIGAGHTVTALYEIALAGSGGARINPLRYGNSEAVPGANASELAFLRMRYKQPGGDASERIEWPLARSAILDDLAAASDDLRFAAAVSAFGQILRGGRYTGGYGYGDVAALARDARGPDPFGYRGEFLSLVGLAEALDTPRSARAGG